MWRRQPLIFQYQRPIPHKLAIDIGITPAGAFKT
jgi:hypothetical protein